ncbi:Zn2/Cys6 DNA-binding protein [Apiospora kogelbergensis]|uniref:Zn2/Cys6 DNA-binding protein n=1 Tax=Apiospora kogelbergensis TaxID=1337665 RepID=A0AAW0QS83_9PEZI
MGRLSRGCLKCRERKVRCDSTRPCCLRCIKRNETCEGYRDEASLTFRYETEKVIEHARVAAALYPTTCRTASVVRRRSRSAEGRSPATPKGSADSSLLTYPWLKSTSENAQVQKEDRAVEQFMDRYVMYPCNETSSPGFLEHLPSLFMEVNVDGRCALRWAVRAAAYAEAARDSEGSRVAQKALHCYGEALSALGKSLAEAGKTPDDHDLMTIALFLPDTSQVGAHTQGMAQILRLRGSDQFYSPRGWSLFRLAHHRIQKHQLAFNQPALSESPMWFEQLNDRVPFVRIEKNAHEIKQTCERARSLLEHVNKEDVSVSYTIEALQELYSLEQTASSWRQGPQWHFRSLSIRDLPPDLRSLTQDIELHGDVWKAYELNYHRTAQILFHQQLTKVVDAVLAKPGLPEDMVLSLHGMMDQSANTVFALVESILATVPQSLGDIDHLGHVADARDGVPKCRSIGCYLLLWPIKIIKSPASTASLDQRDKAGSVYERIRDHTGMKSRLGDLSMLP